MKEFTLRHKMDYEHFKVKVYNSWDLFLHKHQFPYIGRCYAYAKRQDAKTIRNMSKVERDELYDTILPEWETAVNVLFSPFRTNTTSLGNTHNHLAMHLIPRYKKPVELFGISFVDPDYLRNFSPYPKMNIPLETLMYIKDAIKSKL